MARCSPILRPSVGYHTQRVCDVRIAWLVVCHIVPALQVARFALGYLRGEENVEGRVTQAQSIEMLG